MIEKIEVLRQDIMYRGNSLLQKIRNTKVKKEKGEFNFYCMAKLPMAEKIEVIRKEIMYRGNSLLQKIRDARVRTENGEF